MRNSRQSSVVRCPWNVAVLALLALTACSTTNVSETLGLDRAAPDEFTVVSRPSLAVPPEFTLRPPHPGEAPRQPTADATARGLLIGQEAKPGEDVSTIVEPKTPTAVVPVIAKDTLDGAEQNFLKRAGGDAAKDDIRAQLKTDAATPADTSQAKSLVDKVSGAAKEEPVVDAKKEAERLRENKDKGKPANTGAVPEETTKPSSVLDRIF